MTESKRDLFLEAFAKNAPETANALARHGLGLDQLRLLSAEVGREPLRTGRYPDQREVWWSWRDLFEIRGIGPRRLLKLVNFARVQGIELPWFETWDKESAEWSYLKDCVRVEPPVGTTEEEAKLQTTTTSNGSRNY